jgi:RNase P protein component
MGGLVSWTSIGVKREVKEALKNFMRKNNISSENDAIIFLLERCATCETCEELRKILEDLNNSLKRFLDKKEPSNLVIRYLS